MNYCKKVGEIWFQKFLVLDEIGSVGLSSPEVKKRTEGEKNRGEITLEKATARWQPSNQEATLRNINLEIKRGSLIAVIGPVGCGKVQTQLKKIPKYSMPLCKFFFCIGSLEFILLLKQTFIEFFNTSFVGGIEIFRGEGIIIRNPVVL